MNSPAITRFINQFFLNALSRKNRLILIALLVCGAGYGFFLTKFTASTYRSNITIESPFIKSEIMVGLFNDMNVSIAEREYEFLSNKWDIPLYQIEPLRSINAKEIKEYNDKKVVRTSRFNLTVETTTTEMGVIDSIFNVLIREMEQNSYIVKEIEFERNRIKAFKTKVEDKIKDLESLQAKSIDEIAVTQDIFSYHSQMVNLFEKRSLLEKEYRKTAALIVINKDYFPVKNKEKYSNNIFVFSFLPALLWLLILLARAIAKGIDEFNSN